MVFINIDHNNQDKYFGHRLSCTCWICESRHFLLFDSASSDWSVQVRAWRRVDAASGHPRGAGPQIPVGGLLLQQSPALLPGHRHPEHRKFLLDLRSLNQLRSAGATLKTGSYFSGSPPQTFCFSWNVFLVHFIAEETETGSQNLILELFCYLIFQLACCETSEESLFPERCLKAVEDLFLELRWFVLFKKIT